MALIPGSIITEADLAGYEAVWRTPLSQRLRGVAGNLTLHGVPPPGSGAVLGFVLNILHGERKF